MNNEGTFEDGYRWGTWRILHTIWPNTFAILNFQSGGCFQVERVSIHFTYNTKSNSLKGVQNCSRNSPPCGMRVKVMTYKSRQLCYLYSDVLLNSKDFNSHTKMDRSKPVTPPLAALANWGDAGLVNDMEGGCSSSRMSLLPCNCEYTRMFSLRTKRKQHVNVIYTILVKGM